MPSEVMIASRFKGPRSGSAKTTKTHGKLVFEAPTKQEDMYPIQWPPYDNNDVEKRINGVLGPLSLFAPFPHEDLHEEAPMELERPVTPIDREIKSRPTSFDQLAGYIRRRLSPRPDVPHLSFEDQQLLAGILMGEVTGVWPEIRKQIDDPFLNAEENKELNRRISVHIVTVCEQLFLHYLKKAEVLNSRGIFSGPANMSRLKAQLSLDANKFLDILTIRRYLVADIRSQDDGDWQASMDFTYSAPGMNAPAMSYKGLIETSRPKSKTKRFKYKSPALEAQKIINNMPTLDMMKLHDVIADMPDRQLETPSQASEDDAGSRNSSVPSKSSGMSKETKSKEKVLMKRSNSLPQIQMGESLMEELGVEENVREDKLISQEIERLQGENARNDAEKELKASKVPQPGTREYISKDLQNLLGKSEKEKKSDEDMPPLLQAITTSYKHDGQKAVLEKKLAELKEKERKDHEQKSIPLREPTHPQPAVVKAKLPNQMEVRASDIRVSERVCMSSITLDRYATVYNDLLEEIDAATVKQLDRNLFLGDEIREVYQEIMRTIPSQHLDLDDDESVVPAADSVNMSGTMASASLVRKRSDRVINPAFTKPSIKPPWGEMDQKQWVKTPNNPPKNFQGEDVFAPLSNLEDILQLTPNMDKVHEVIRNPTKMSQLLTKDDIPSFVQDKMARTYASWLLWWKSTITSDDYMKYLSTQETDYMAAVFHFYDSGEEDEGEDEGPSQTHYPFPSALRTTGMLSQKRSQSRTTHSSKQTLEKEKEKKIKALQEQKAEFQEGFWNVNSVLLGGLGKDPVIEEEVDESASKAPKSADTQRSAKTLQERAAARHSAKKSRQDVTQSRASKVTTLTVTSKLETDRSSVSDGGEAPLTPQDRLEKVWTALEMPDSLKLDMAIKYSCNEFYTKLAEAIEQWEKVTDLVLKREALLVKLEKFERMASDPNRFFEKGQKRSSVQRLKEAQQRSYYYKRIEAADIEIKEELQLIKKQFKDVITYKGRPYQDKMKWDRIEMLHWLQEERKQNALQYEALMKNIPLKSAQLEPIPLSLPVQKVA
ncbi:coiled-coil domain-containing protein 87-like isoform X2 [Ruditapes philippinarum]|uniref:coiled-coil domain-containing protein 87-like isoform X2 n=1 Tax=Ruditapes philippinarum TaxID=129788 RepID=UPI00295AFC77|nr:coiled-coil domain-containing protein 87-like isoform X2 [Ruditapes philippinarum]